MALSALASAVTPRHASVLLVRHAHAEWPAWRGRDFDRPLTPRGERDAAATGIAIREAGLAPATVLASPARRTRQTAEIILRELGVSEANLVLVEDLYNATADKLLEELRKAATVPGPTMLVAHNPGISDLGRELDGNARAAAFAPADWRLLLLT